jgi:hypothetical protein
VILIAKHPDRGARICRPAGAYLAQLIGVCGVIAVLHQSDDGAFARADGMREHDGAEGERQQEQAERLRRL